MLNTKQIDGLKAKDRQDKVSYPEIGLAKARLLNGQFKDQIAHGSICKSPLFDEVKQDWYLHHLPKLKNIKRKQQVMYRLDEYVSPRIGKMPIDTIKRTDLVMQGRTGESLDVIEDWLTDIAIYSGQLLLQNIQEAVITQAKATGNQELAEVTINLLDETLDTKTLLSLTDEQGEVPGMEGEGLPQLNANQPQLQIPQQIVQQQGVQNGY